MVAFSTMFALVEIFVTCTLRTAHCKYIFNKFCRSNIVRSNAVCDKLRDKVMEDIVK